MNIKIRSHGFFNILFAGYMSVFWRKMAALISLFNNGCLNVLSKIEVSGYSEVFHLSTKLYRVISQNTIIWKTPHFSLQILRHC